MKINALIIVALLLTLAGCNDIGKGDEPSVDLREVGLTEVRIGDGFWRNWVDNNIKVSVPAMLDAYENMERAPDPKLIEAVGYILLTNPDVSLQARMDVDNEKLIARMIPGGKPRAWKNLLNGEMYSAGHFMEAAVSYFNATGNRRMLDVAIMLADDIDANFGPGKRLDVSQHEELKIGLLKLYGVTGDEKYMKLAEFFMDERGRQGNGRQLYGEYAQDHKPVVEQEEAVGHTVRATYLYTPLAELAMLTGRQDYIDASDRLWEDATLRKTYLTGSIGSYRDMEDYGVAYELPNLDTWNETCASIGNIFWNHKMFLLHGDGKYVDMVEKVLYNGFLSGLSVDGTSYFYQNPLKTYGGFGREPWFGPNCCPPNIVRLIGSLGKYIYATDNKSLYVNLFIGSSVSTRVGGSPVSLKQETAYPWDGNIRLTVGEGTDNRFALKIRIPGWTGSDPVPASLYSFEGETAPAPVIKVNGKPVKATVAKGYAVADRKWKEGDIVEIDFPMPVRRVIAHEAVIDNRGMVALQRGPLVYCLEETDNGGGIMDIILPENVKYSISTADIGGWVTIVSGKALKVSRNPEGERVTSDTEFTAIPYYAWANRGRGAMTVWIAADASRAELPPVTSIASTSRVSSSVGEGMLADNYPGGKVPHVAVRFYPSAQSGSAGLKAVNDQLVPANSFDGSSTYLSLRPQQGDAAWVQYDFAGTETISSSEVYWKDDKQTCLMPESWQLLYREGNRWIPVKNLTAYTVEKDRFNKVDFEPVTTSGLRLEIKLKGQLFRKGELGPPDGNYMPEDTMWYEAGVIEWIVSK